MPANREGTSASYYCPDCGGRKGINPDFCLTCRGVPEDPEPMALSDDEPVDVTELVKAGEGEPEPMVVESLFPYMAIVAIAGEEGGGKTTLADQICRQMLRKERVCEMFETGDRRPDVILFVDTEQMEPEATRRALDMEARELDVEPGRLWWWSCPGLDLTQETDQSRLHAWVTETGAEFLWIDSGNGAISDPNDGVAVKRFFVFLAHLMKQRELKGIGLTLHPRKRPSGEYGRRFDDLFGSREFKGRTTKAFYIEGQSIVCWKDRGGHIGRLWTGRKGPYAAATLERPGETEDESVLFRISPKEPEPVVDAGAIRAKVLELVASQPDHFTKTSLAEAAGGRKQDALLVVRGLVESGDLVPPKARAKLSLASNALIPSDA